MVGYGGRDQQSVRRGMQFKMFVRMGQGVVGYEGRDVRKFRRLGAQKFFARGSIKKEIANRDRGAERQARLFYANDLAAVDFEDGSGWFVGSPRFKVQTRNRGDRGQRFAAKTESCNAQQV